MASGLYFGKDNRSQLAEAYADLEKSKKLNAVRRDIEDGIRKRGQAMIVAGVIEDAIPNDIRQMAENLGIPALSESVWVNGFQTGFALAMRYAALPTTEAADE